MLERLLDLAVYALVAALVAIGVSKILDQRRDAQTIAWTESVTRAMDRLAGTSTGYAAVAGTDMTAQLTASTLLPVGMIDRSSGSAVLRNAFGGAIVVTGSPDRFTIAQDALPQRACAVLIARAREWARQIRVNGTDAPSIAGADAAWASQSCSQNGNSIVVTIMP